MLSKGFPAFKGVQLEMRPPSTLFDWIRCFGVFDLKELESMGFGNSFLLRWFYKKTDGVCTVSPPRFL